MPAQKLPQDTPWDSVVRSSANLVHSSVREI